jgi:phenylpyruvate tautomerase PptA (4-oxalocrotonate tautomerase family)
MPLIYVNYPEGTFTQEALDGLAEQITKDAIQAEKLAGTPYVKSTTWVYFNEYARRRVYHGGKSGGTTVISLEVNAIDGGFDVAAKKELIKRITDAVSKYAGMKDGELRPVYIVMRDVPETDWGFSGEPIKLEALKNPPSDAKPI